MKVVTKDVFAYSYCTCIFLNVNLKSCKHTVDETLQSEKNNVFHVHIICQSVAFAEVVADTGYVVDG